MWPCIQYLNSLPSDSEGYITLEDIPLIIKVVLSTASIERVTMFDLLLAYKGTMTTTQIANSLNISQPTALRTMTELKALGLVDMIDGDSNTPAKITLDPRFNWVFDKQFLELRNGFVPSDNSEYMQKKRKEKLPPATTISSDQQHKEKISSITDDNLSLPNNNNGEDVNDNSSEGVESKKLEIKFVPDYEAGEPIFWRVFEELSTEGKGFVNYDKLQERLISTGKFYAGDAVLMIEHTEKIGKIEQTEQYHVYRRISASLN